MATATWMLGGFLEELVGVVEMGFSSAVTFCCSVHGLPLVSVTSTMTCVGWLTVADCKPGPLTWQV